VGGTDGGLVLRPREALVGCGSKEVRNFCIPAPGISMLEGDAIVRMLDIYCCIPFTSPFHSLW
jgi:hypothetical protein